MLENFKVLTGYDNQGTVYDAEEFVLREIQPEHLGDVLAVYGIYEKYDLSRLGIVETDLAPHYGKNIFKHKKHVISYPFEWTANMFKDAVIHHLNLFIKLDKYGLTLKDAQLTNVLFGKASPVFIDFLSLIRKEKLVDESWLKDIQKSDDDDRQLLIFDKMFFPFIFVPLIIFGGKNYEASRDMLFNRACNVPNCTPPSWRDLFDKRGDKKYFSNLIETLKLYFLIRSKRKLKFVSFCKELLNFVEEVDVAPAKSDYDSYYDGKNENLTFDFLPEWGNKQKSVYKVLNDLKPKTVLDLGANTGWFSILAARQGARVISTDIDESSVDLLYRYSKKNNLNITPLLLPFENFEKKLHGIDNGRSHSEKQRSLFLPATERLKSDVVLCLALFHHLILGMGLTIDKVLSILSIVTCKTLVLEFISIDDKLIQEDYSFFKNLSLHTKDSYNVDLVVKQARKYFSKVCMLPSHPDSRVLLILSK